MSTLKAFGVVAVMIACFVVIYPRFMHPFVLRGLGLYEPPPKEGDNTMYPPHYRAMHPAAHKPQTTSDDARKQHAARQSPPHPGMRAAADMQRQQSQQGSGRGMMGVVLPMYAIGIVLYLVYTLFKVFNKSKNSSWNGEEMQYNRLDRDYPVDNLGLPVDYENSGDVRSFFTNDEQRKELEHLLTRVDDKNVSLDEMRLLQKRLEETESQMSRILKAMQSVQRNVNLTEVPQDEVPSKAKSKDLSPDLENDDGLETEGGMVENKGKQKDVENEYNRKSVGTDVPSNNGSEKLESESRKLKQETDFGGIDKGVDGITGNVIDDREREENAADENFDENTEDADPTKASESNIRHRKGRCDNEQ